MTGESPTRVSCPTCGVHHRGNEPWVRLRESMQDPETLRMTCANPAWIDVSVELYAALSQVDFKPNRSHRRKLERSAGLKCSASLVPYMVNQGVPAPEPGRAVRQLNITVARVEASDAGSDS